ncbi:Piso0_001991 [Millerozyma farinosa CBS 7064]|uniref:Piso0_001991 protein n=1 Tax=Pichia sorbitophila (strain ATCC MYA-4447 / BCRC 22081 / CBS 7064 / NBRC 10061 / NRRL Y-12695) TaxID=559304 RepID=G8YM88_PICSO|nr:Piso0_001991 [Millerozyma farinosa CBS 7064]
MSYGINHDLVKYAYENLNHIPKGHEYEKMISGLPYDINVEALAKGRILAHEKVADYGQIRLGDYGGDIEQYYAAKEAHLATVFGKVGSNVKLEHPFFVDYGFNVSIGDDFYGNFNCTFLDCSLITFGDKCLLGPNVTFATPTHPLSPSRRSEGEESADAIIVGNNVWFGANAVILRGVTIGDNSIIGAGAVVRDDVPPNSLVVGSPAKVIKNLDGL